MTFLLLVGRRPWLLVLVAVVAVLLGADPLGAAIVVVIFVPLARLVYARRSG